MTPEEIRELADEVQRVFPRQAGTDMKLERWPAILDGIRYSEALIAVAMLKYFVRWAEPEQIAARVRLTRTKLQEPSGDAWEARRARHNGEEYQGGPVCWPPDICVGSCSACPNTAGEVGA